jgi:hypothetical protein
VWTLLKRSEKEGGYRWSLFIARVGYVALHVAPIASARIWKGKTKILILLKKNVKKEIYYFHNFIYFIES